jgi:hypothetical protein
LETTCTGAETKPKIKKTAVQATFNSPLHI